MYGLLLKGAMKAAPHVAGLGAAGYIGGKVTETVAPDFLEGLYGNTVEVDDEGNYKGRGLGAAILKPFVNEGDIETKKQKGAVKRTIVSAGEDPKDYILGDNATIYDAQGAIATKLRERAQQQKEKDQEFSLRPLQMQMEENRALRRDQMMMRADDLALQRDRLMLEDQRYNERLDREERNRRQEAIMAMMSGLASLGAAFAM